MRLILGTVVFKIEIIIIILKVKEVKIIFFNGGKTEILWDLYWKLQEEEKSWKFRRNATHTEGNCCVQDVSIDHSLEYSSPLNWQNQKTLTFLWNSHNSNLSSKISVIIRCLVKFLIHYIFRQIQFNCVVVLYKCLCNC